MTQAFASRIPREFSWVWLAIVAVALTPASLTAQSSPAAKDDKKPPVDGAKGDDPDPAPTEQVFVDPNAKKALTVFNPLTFPGPALRVGAAGDDRSKMQGMAARSINIDPEFIKRYIEFFAIELTKRENLNAVLNPPATMRPLDPASRALERAVDALNKPIIDAKANDNKEFLAVYYRTMFESTLVKLLEPNHNYLSRIDAMIVLGMAGNPSPAALDLYISQLKKADQLVWIRLWAARGLTIAAQEGEVNLEAAKANQSAEALIVLLDGDPKLPWPVQMRALEALGSLRVSIASTSPWQGRRRLGRHAVPGRLGRLADGPGLGRLGPRDDEGSLVHLSLQLQPDRPGGWRTCRGPRQPGCPGIRRQSGQFRQE